MSSIFDTPEKTGEFDSNDIQESKIVAGIGYLPPLFFLPLVVNQKSRFGRFHANQALLVLILVAVLWVVNTVLGLLDGIPVVGIIFTIVNALLSFVLGISVFIGIVMGMINAFTGKAKQLPIIGGYTILK